MLLSEIDGVQEFDAKCVEMEAAGLMDDFPCMVDSGRV